MRAPSPGTTWTDAGASGETPQGDETVPAEDSQLPYRAWIVGVTTASGTVIVALFPEATGVVPPGALTCRVAPARVGTGVGHLTTQVVASARAADAEPGNRSLRSAAANCVPVPVDAVKAASATG